ncbi:MAG: hypothetical protein HQK50_18435, partial [Oligoflexia bacterium]|nr:hypothetical protein [Oligoflexia bacterium]
MPPLLLLLILLLCPAISTFAAIAPIESELWATITLAGSDSSYRFHKKECYSLTQNPELYQAEFAKVWARISSKNRKLKVLEKKLQQQGASLNRKAKALSNSATGILPLQLLIESLKL